MRLKTQHFYIAVDGCVHTVLSSTYGTNVMSNQKMINLMFHVVRYSNIDRHLTKRPFYGNYSQGCVTLVYIELY